VRKGAPWLKTTSVQCAWAAVRKKDSYLKAQFLRIKTRRGPKKAIMAVAASILTAIYHMLKDGTLYQDLGSNHFQTRSKGQQTQRLVKRLADLGYEVALKPLSSYRFAGARREGLFLSSDEAGVMLVERRGRVIAVELGPTGGARRSPKVQRKAAAFARWHEPDDARVSSPDL
jgi:hypothetical protein